MKNIIFTTMLSVSFYALNLAQGQFKIKNDAFIQIGYTGYKALTFGQGTASPNNGNFGIEHCSGCVPAGLNIWKPWPTAGWANYLLFIRDNGNVGIGCSGDAGYKLKINGNIWAASGTINGSDKRFKENVQAITNQLDNLLKIKPYQYHFIQSEKKVGDSLSVNVNKDKVIDYNFDNNLHFGMFAQDIKEIYPNLVTEDENGYLGLNYTEFIPLIIQALQEQNKKIIKLEEEIRELKK